MPQETTARRNFQGLVKAEFDYKREPGDDRPPITVENRNLESSADREFVIELADMLRTADETELVKLWHILRRRRRARNNGRDVGLQEASVMEYVDDEDYQCHEAEALFLDGFHRLVTLANQVRSDREGRTGAGALLRAVVDQIPEEFDELVTDASDRWPLPSLASD